MATTNLCNLSRKGLLRVLAEQNDALLAGQSEIKAQLTSFQETVLMALNKNEQDVVNRIDQSTTKVADVITKASDAIQAGTQAIRDLFNNQSSITLADVAPKLDAMDSAADTFGSAADALKTIATQDDPALGTATTPITVTAPDGTETPVSTTDTSSETPAQ